MKKTLSILLLLALTLCLFSCADKGEYLDDVNTASVANAMVASLAADLDYTTVGADYLSDFVTIPASVKSCSIMISTEGNDLNEIGVFHVDAEKGSVDEVKKVIETYLTDSLTAYQSWYDGYIPQETPKLINAEVKVFGNYVIYAILSDADKTEAFAAAADVLAVKK